MKRGIFLDDDEEERNLYSGLLSGGEIHFEGYPPEAISKLIALVEREKPDIMAIDYRLDGIRPDEAENTYRAGTPAQTLRANAAQSHNSDFPIILVSTEQNIHQLFHPDKTSHDLFDLKLLKEDVANDQNSNIQTRLASLCEGYDFIKAHSSDADFHFLMLGIRGEDWGMIEPAGFLNALEDASRVPHVIARIVMRYVIDRAGLLLASKDVAARFGVPREYGEEALAKMSELGMYYKGIFWSGWSRIWRYRLDQWEFETFGRILTEMPGHERVEALNKALGTVFPAVKSKWNESTREKFLFACASCDDPTELNNSVAAYDPTAPLYVERRRCCFDCVIREKPLEERNLKIEDLDWPLAADVRSGKIKRQ